MEWITRLFNYIFNLFPRLYTVTPDNGGVRITLGKYVKTLKPGWYIVFYMFQETRLINVVPQIIDLRPQSTITKDKKNVIISGAIKYRISDARKALLEVENFDTSIQNMAIGIIQEHSSNHTFDELTDIDNTRDVILKGIKEEAKGMGIYIMRVYITDIGLTRNFRILTNNIVL